MVDSDLGRYRGEYVFKAARTEGRERAQGPLEGLFRGLAPSFEGKRNRLASGDAPSRRSADL